MKKSILSLVLLSSISIAHATGSSNNCNGNGSCPQNETTTVNSTNQGGVGYGGAGGSATSVSTGGSATGGSSTAYGGASNVDVRNSSSNINANTVKNESTNIQGQQQQQAIKNSGNSSSTSGVKNSGNNTGNASNSVTVQGDNFESARNPVNTAYAPPVAATANCALGVSGGVSFVGFSGSFGKAYVDENCAMLEKVRAVSQVLGDKATAEALMCLDPKYAKARLNAGRACPVEQE